MYGVNDEEARLNASYASPEELGKLYLMTPEVAAAIVDWRDDDSTVTPGGAEAEYYASLQPPYLPRNAPFQTLRELLMVRGVSPELSEPWRSAPRASSSSTIATSFLMQA